MKLLTETELTQVTAGHDLRRELETDLLILANNCSLLQALDLILTVPEKN